MSESDDWPLPDSEQIKAQQNARSHQNENSIRNKPDVCDESCKVKEYVKGNENMFTEKEENTNPYILTANSDSRSNSIFSSFFPSPKKIWWAEAL